MFFILENKQLIQDWLKKEYSIDLEQEYEDTMDLKNGVFSSLYKDAKTCLSMGTVGSYRRKIASCGNNRKKMIKQAILSLGNAVYKKKLDEMKFIDKGDKDD